MKRLIFLAVLAAVCLTPTLLAQTPVGILFDDGLGGKTAVSAANPLPTTAAVDTANLEALENSISNLVRQIVLAEVQTNISRLYLSSDSGSTWTPAAPAGTSSDNASYVTNYWEATMKTHLANLEILANEASNHLAAAGEVVAVTPWFQSGALAEGQAACYNFEIPIGRTNAWLTSIKCISTDTNVPASVVLPRFDLYLFKDAVTAQTLGGNFELSAADWNNFSSGPWQFGTATPAFWTTNRVANTYAGSGVVHVPGVATTNTLNILCVPGNGAKLRGCVKAMSGYTLGSSVAENTNRIKFLFKFLPDK